MKKNKTISIILAIVLTVISFSTLIFALQKSTTETNDSPKFAWIDDDGKAAVYSKLYPWAVENNVPITSAVILGKVNVRGWLTSQNIIDMYQSGYVRFADHTISHVKLPSIDASELDFEIGTAKTQLEELGVPCDVMVYPAGQSNEQIINVTKKYFSIGFAAGGGYTDPYRINYLDSADIYKLERLSIDCNSDIDFIKAQIDHCCDTGGVLVFMSHVGSTDGATGGASAEQDIVVYQTVVDYIRFKGYDISTVLDACERFISSDDTIVEEPDTNNEGYILAGADEYSNSNTPSDFPENCVITNYISYNNTIGFPNNSRGILTTYNLGSSAYQVYSPSIKNTIYIRIRKSNSDEWLEWKDINDNYLQHVSNNNIHENTAPRDLPDGITVCLISEEEHLNLLPENQLGYLTSYRISASASNARQEWQPVNSVAKYVREATSASKWGPWYKFEPEIVIS